MALVVRQGFQQVEHTAAFSEDGFVRGMMGADRGQHGGVGGEWPQVKFGIAPGEIEGVRWWQLRVGEGREEGQLGAQVREQFQVGAVEKSEGGIAGHGNAYPREGLGLRGMGANRRRTQRLRSESRVETDHRRQGWVRQPQGRCGLVQARLQVSNLRRLHQPQVAGGQGDISVAGQPAQTGQIRREALRQQLIVPLAGGTIGEGAGEGQARAVAGQAQRQGAEGLGHVGAIDHRQDGDAEQARQVGAGTVAIEQPHDPFDEDEIGLPRRLEKELAAVGLAAHPQVELVDRPA